MFNYVLKQLSGAHMNTGGVFIAPITYIVTASMSRRNDYTKKKSISMYILTPDCCFMTDLKNYISSKSICVSPVHSKEPTVKINLIRVGILDN